MSDSNAISLGIGVETTIGTAATGPYQAMNASSVNLTQQKGTAQSNTIRSDRNLPGIIQTNLIPSGGFGFDMIYQGLDPLWPGIMGNAISTPVSLSAIAGTVAGSVFTATAGTPFTVCVPGQWLAIVISGVKYICRITAIGGAGANITVTGATLPVGAQTITTAKGKYVRNGTTMKGYTLERYFTDQASKPFFASVGCVPNTLNINAQAEQIVTGDLAFMGLGVLPPSTTSQSGAGYTAAITNQSFAGLSGNVGQFIVNGTLVTPAIMAIKGMNISVTNNARRDAGINVSRMGWGQYTVTGTLDTYFQGGLAAVDAFFADTPGSISYVMTDPSGNAMVFTIDAVKFSNFTNTIGGKNQAVMGTMAISAFLGTTYTDTLQVDFLDL